MSDTMWKNRERKKLTGKGGIETRRNCLNKRDVPVVEMADMKLNNFHIEAFCTRYKDRIDETRRNKNARRRIEFLLSFFLPSFPCAIVPRKRIIINRTNGYCGCCCRACAHSVLGQLNGE